MRRREFIRLVGYAAVAWPPQRSLTKLPKLRDARQKQATMSETECVGVSYCAANVTSS